MFNFNPFRKVSSFALSKFLTPYFSSIDESQINVGFWKGEIKLSNLELSKNFFFLNNIDLEVLYSVIKEIKVKIPWNSINSQPIEISITGVKLVISNALQRSKKQKKEMKEQLNKLKKEALSQYDKTISKAGQGDNPAYLSTLIQNLMQNAKLIIEDINVIFVYQIKDFELVKFGLSVRSFQIFKSQKEDTNKDCLRKGISVSKVSMFFEFYDSVNLNDKFREFESPFHDAVDSMEKQEKLGKGGMHESTGQRPLSKNYIINNFDFFIELKFEYMNGMAVELVVSTGPILIFLKQRQLRHLTRAVQAILYFRSDRPEIKPGVGNGSVLWWKYACKTFSNSYFFNETELIVKRILNEEKIPLKIKNKDLLIFYKAEKYKNLYIKAKLVESHLVPKERIFLETFEEGCSLAEILSLRNLALETIASMKQKLSDDSDKQQRLAREWFEQFTIANPIEMFGDLNLNLLKKEQKPFKLQISLECGRLDLLIQENEMLKSLKKLHNYVTVFTEALEEKKELRDKILNHIKENFVQEISSQQRYFHNMQADLERESSELITPLSGKRRSFENWNENMKVDQFLNQNNKKHLKKKMLLQITVHSLKLRYEIQDFLTTELQLSVKTMEGIDMHKLNSEYRRFLDIPKGFTLFMTSTSSKLHREGFEDWLMKINLDLNLETFQMTLCKPFFERINSLLQMVMFDPKKFYEESLKKDKYEAERQYVFFNTILLERKKVTRELNLSLNIENINIYFPFQYSTRENMLLLQIKDFRLYRREDQKDIRPPDKPENISRKSTMIPPSAGHHPNSKKTLLEFNPIFLRLNCLKILIVSDYAWEEKENLFLQNLQKLKAGKLDKEEASPLNIGLNSEVFANEERGNSSKIIMETLPISFRLEKFKTLYKIKNEEYLEVEKKIKRMHITDCEITPQTSKLTIDLPMIIINLTISQLYTLMSLIKSWQESGPDLYKAVMELSNTNPKPDTIKASQKTKGNPVPSNQFAQRNAFIDPNINYGGCAIEEFLETFELSSVLLNCDGFNLSLFLKNFNEKEIVGDDLKHNNKLFSFFVDKTTFSESQLYFHTIREIEIKKIIFQSHNCLDLDLRSLCKRIIEKKMQKDRLNEKDKFSAPKNTSASILAKNSQIGQKNSLKNDQPKIQLLPPNDPITEVKTEKNDDESYMKEIFEDLNNLSRIKESDESKQELINDDHFLSLLHNKENSTQQNPKVTKEKESLRKCKFCFEKTNPHRNRLIINSLSSSKEQSYIYTQFDNENHIKMSIRTTERELEKFRRKKVTYSDIELKLADFIITIDPIVNQTVRSIFDLGNEYADINLKSFKIFMRNNGFWPDFMFRECDPQKEVQMPSLKPEVADSRLTVVLNSLTLLFHFKRKNIYVLNAKSLIFISENWNVYSGIRLSADKLSVHDTSKNAGNHTNLIMNYDKNKNSRLDCEIKLFDQNFSRIKKYSTYVGIRIMNARVVFLKRIVNEFVEYIRKHFLTSFYPQEPTTLPKTEPSKSFNKQSVEPRVPSTLKLEVLVSDSMIALYQNSISQNLLYVEFKKICVWSTGQWGMEMGELFRTGMMDFEKGDEDSLNKPEEFQDMDEETPVQSPLAPSLTEFMKKPNYNREQEEKNKPPDVSNDGETIFFETRTLKGKEILSGLNEFLEISDQKSLFRAQRQEDLDAMSHSKNSEDLDGAEAFRYPETKNGIFKEIYRIKIEDLNILTSKESQEEETLFIKAPKESLTIDINIEDEDFVKEELDDNKNSSHSKAINPITIHINMQKLWLYSYEPEFALLMSILQENLGEIPMTVTDPTPVDKEDTTYNLYVKVLVEEALLKIYKGTREELKEQSRRTIFEKSPRFLYKNSSSLALINLKDINFRMLMQNNGGKRMILSISKLNISDLRLTSRLTHYNKCVLFSYVTNQFNNEESTMTTTTQDPPSPFREMAFNAILDNANMEELNQNMEMSHEQDKGMEIELNFDQKPNNPIENQNANEKNRDQRAEEEKSMNNDQKIENNQEGEDIEESSKRELKPKNSLNNRPNEEANTSKGQRTWKDKIKSFFSSIFSKCKRRKNRTIGLFDLVPGVEANQSPSYSKRKDTLFLNPRDLHSGLKNFVIRDKLVRASQELPDFVDQNPQNDYIIHNLKSVKQPSLEDSEGDDRRFFKKDAEFKLIFTSRYDGEKLIKINLSSKNLIVLIDWLGDLVKFFMKPFDGTNIPNYFRKSTAFNNNPPMIVRVELTNIYLILMADFNTKQESESIAAMVDLNYEHKWLGDAYIGPGSIEIAVFLRLKRFCLFRTLDLINNSFIKGEFTNRASFPFFNLLVEPFEVKFVSTYRIAFYIEDKTLEEKRKYNPKEISDEELMSSYSEKYLKLKNPNGRKEIHLLIKKIKGISQVISLLSDPSILSDPQNSINSQQSHLAAKNPPPLIDNQLLCIEQFDFSIEQINIHILKNKNKIHYGKLIFKEFRLVGIRKTENYKIKLRGTILIDYFNKRRMDFEPLLEPWTFLLTACQVKEDFQILLQNDPTNQEEAIFVKENKNSLNLNITTAAIETLLDAYKTFSDEKKNENEPCKLHNKMGCIIRYRNAKMQEKQKHFWLPENRTCDIWSKFQPKKSSRISSKSAINHTAINILLVNKDLSSIIPEAQLMPVDEKPVEEENPNFVHQNLKLPLHQYPKILNTTTATSTTARTMEKRPKKSLKNIPEIRMNKSGNLASINEYPKKVSLLESQPDFVILNDPTQKELETIYEYSENSMNLNKLNTPISDIVRGEPNFFQSKKKKVYQSFEGLSEKDHKLSDYRMIKDVSLDHVGKTVYKLERINRFDQSKQNNNKNIFGIDIGFDFDSLDFLSKTRKINEEGNNYMLMDIRFSPKKGHKEIFVTTCVKFINKLNADIELGFYWKYKKNPLETKVIKPDHEYYIPLKYIEASTLVTFKNNRMGGLDNIHWEDERPDDLDEDSNIEEINEDENPCWEKSAGDSPENKNATLYKSLSNAGAFSSLPHPPNTSNIGSNTFLKPSDQNINNKKSPGKTVQLNENRERGNSQNQNNAIFNRVPISAEYEKHDLDRFICDKVTLGEFEPAENHLLFKKEHTKKGGLLVYKNDFVVNSIHHHGKASFRNFYFILSCVKSKMETQKRHNKEREEICYETTLILLPIFKITNLTMSPLTIEYGGFANTNKKKNQKTHDEEHKYSKKTLFPKSSYGCSDIYYGEDFSFNVSICPSGGNSDNTLKSSDIKIYRSEKNFNVPIKLKAKSSSHYKDIPPDIRDYKGKSFYLWAEFKKNSPKSREIIIFCPYLIIDETNQLMFKESSSFFNPKKFFKNRKQDKNLLAMKGTMNISQTLDKKDSIHKEEFYEDMLDKTNFTNPALKERFKKELEVYRKIHMFSTSKKMKAIQIALKDSLKQWSKPCPLQTTEEVLTVVEAPTDRDLNQQDRNSENRYDNLFNNFLNIAINRQQTVKQARKKYQYGVRILPAPHPFSRSKLIVFTPRYVIKNECDNLIAIAQYDTEHSEDDIIRIRKDQWHEFHWTDHKKKEYLVMSLCNKVTGNVFGWSGKVKIDKVQEMVVKLRKNQDNEYEFTKVSINIYDNVQCIRILKEDRENPPYSLHNETNHEIAFRHKIKIGNKRNQEEVPFTILYPGDSLHFTWEQWDDENDRILQVEIDGQVKEYPIEKTQECEPFILNPPTIILNKQSKTHIYKKGSLQICQNDKKRKDEYYCVLSVAKQKMKLYDNNNSKRNTINVKGAKIENLLENEFILKTAKNVTYQFEAKNEAEKSDWMNHIWKSILLENPEIIFVKIEPENLTKAIKFHSEGENFLLPYRDNDDVDDQIKKGKRKESTYTFKITNAIGISIIDSLPREILHISIKKVELSLFAVESVSNEKQSDGVILVEKGDTIIKTSWINLSIDSFIINNQIMDAQFPVILAPNKKKINENQQFFMCFLQTKSSIRPPSKEIKEVVRELNREMSLQRDPRLEISIPSKEVQREHPKEPQVSSLTHVEQMKIVFDSIEVRIEDLLIDALYDFYLEISPALNNIDIKDDLKLQIPFDIRTLEMKLDGKLKQNSNKSKQMVYIKGMLFHPIEICFSFRDNPGQQQNTLIKNWGSYLGISFISIDSAKIKLGMLDQLHFFGSWEDALLKILKHYKKNLWNQLKKLFFSMDILGNPYSLGESVAVGLKEIVLNPMQDLVKLNFDKFGKGIALGSVGFVKNTLTSVYTSLERILGTIMKTFSKMTRDKEYLYGRQIMKNRTLKRVREGVYMGVRNLLRVLADVVLGIPRLISTEIRLNGCFLGFFIGLYDVVASAVVKPIVSLYDLFIAVIEGFKNSDKYEGHIMEVRSRPPRIFNQENLVVPYTYNPAMLKLLIMKYKLREIDSERVEYFDEFKVITREFPLLIKKTKETIYQVILTDYRLLFAEKMSAIFCKKISLHKIQDIHFDLKRREFIFKFQVPMQKKYCCQLTNMDFRMPVGSLEKAEALGKILKKQRQKGELELKREKEKETKEEGKQKGDDNHTGNVINIFN